VPFQSSSSRPVLVPDQFQNAFDLGFFVGGDAEEWAAGASPVVAVEVAGVLHSADAELADDTAIGLRDALLLLLSQLQVVVLPGEINLLASLGSERGETPEWLRKRLLAGSPASWWRSR